MILNICQIAARIGAGFSLLGALGLSTGYAAEAADSVYRNATVYTVDAHDSIQQALAVRQGTIVYVGSEAGAKSWIGPQTQVHDVGGHVLMPGLVDGHMHPLAGGRTLVGCNLKYERLTIAQVQEHVRHCLEETRDREPDAWLTVHNWFQEAMIGNKVMTREMLDALPTKRPIMIQSSFGHTALVNTRALEMAHITAATRDPIGGQVERDARGAPTGLLQDAAMEPIQKLIPPSTPQEDVQAAEAALDAMREQGITTFLDAAANPATIAAFAGAEKQGHLTARAHFAVVVRPSEAGDPKKAIAAVQELRARYDEGPIVPAPHLTVRNIKLFLDGVITAPAMTGAMLEPYFVNVGTAEHPDWKPGSSRGPAVYFAPDALRAMILEAVAHNFEPHMHADGDAAVHAGLDAVAALREKYPGSAIRAAIAHDEIVSPADFPRYAKLDAIPVLSMQWEKRAPDTVDGAEDYLGPQRYRYVEPAGFLADAGARIAYGSDWPVDPLNEWFALKVGVTRMNAPDAGAKYRAPLSQDHGLPLATALRAITENSSYELHQEKFTGSLEAGKLADFIILDRDILHGPPESLAQVKVLETVVGGRSVYRAQP